MTSRGNKIVLLGESSVGKSAIAIRIARNSYAVNYESTIGAAYHNVKIDDNVKLDIWDTAGQERYMALAPMYYRNARIILLVFDLTDYDTLDRLVTYLDRFMEEGIKGAACFVIGNKKDLIDDYQLKKKHHLITDKFERFKPFLSKKIEYFYTSAKDNINIYELKQKIIEICKESIDETIGTKIVLTDMPTNHSRCTC